MAEDAGSIYSEIRILLSGLDRDLKTASSRFNTFNKTVEKGADTSSKKVNQSWTTAYVATGIIVEKTIQTILRSYKEAVSVFAGFEQSIVNASTVIGDAENSFASLEEAARKVGATTRLTASQAADALYQLGSAGLSAKESIEALDGVVNLSLATQADLSESARLTVAAVNQFNLAFKDSEKVANTFVASITSTPATLQKLGKGLEYVGPIAGGLNLELEEVIGSLGLLFEAGFTGEKAGRALRGALIDLADATSPVNQRLKDLGINYQDINPATNDLASIIGVLADAQINASNAGAVFGKVQGPQMAVLIREGEEQLRAYTEAVTGTQKAQEIATKQMDTLQGSFDILKSVAQESAITFIGSVSPALRSFTDTLTAVLTAINKAPKALIAFSTALGTAGAALGSTMVLLKLFGVTLSAMFGPIGLVVAGIFALGTALYSANKEAEKKGLKSLASDIDELADGTKRTREEILDTNKVLSRFNRMFETGDKFVVSAINSGREYSGILDTMEENVNKLAKQYEISNKEVLKGVLLTSDLSDVTREYLENMLDEIILKELLQEENKALGKTYQEVREAYLRDNDKMNNSDLEREQLVQEGYAKLETVFRNSAQLFNVLGESYDSTGTRLSAYENVLEDFIEAGLTAEAEEVQFLISLYEDLLDRYSSTANMDERRKKIIEATNESQSKLRSTFEQTAVAVGLVGDSYDSNAARQQALLSGIKALTDLGLKEEGASIQNLLRLYAQLQEEYKDTAQGTKAQTELATEYKDKLDELNKSIRERVIAQKEVDAGELIASGRAKEGLALFAEAERGKQEEINRTYSIEKQLLLKRIEAGEAGQQELVYFEQYYGKLREEATRDTNEKIEDATEEALERQKAFYKAFGEFAISVFGSVADIINLVFDSTLTRLDNKIGELQARLDQINEKYDTLADQAEADAENRSNLINEQIEEEQRIEQERIAQVARDKATASALELEQIERADIDARIAYEARIAELEALANAEEQRVTDETALLDKQRADELSADTQALNDLENERKKIEKQAFEANKAIAIINAGIAGAQAIMQGYAQLGPVGGSIAAGIITGITAAQVGIIASKEFPEYATGGIEPAVNGGRLVKVAEDGNELMLSDGPKGQGMMEAFARSIAQYIGGDTIVSIKMYTPDEKFIGDYITRGSRTGQFTMDPRVLKRRN